MAVENGVLQGGGTPSRIETQLALIKAALPHAVAYAPPGRDPAEGPDYLAHEGYVLIRAKDRDRVHEFLGRRLDSGDGSYTPQENGGEGLEETTFGGITRLPVDARMRSVDALPMIDEEFGPGVATPDHVCYVVAHSCCPGKEPEEPPAGTAGPVPALTTDAGAGQGVRVSVLDTGLFDVGGQFTWMAGVEGDPEQPYDPATGTIRPYAGHGAFCAGTIRAVAPAAGVRIENSFVVPHHHEDRTVHDHGAGAGYESDLARQAVEAFERYDPDVVCLAFGTNTRDDLEPLGFEALRELVAQRKGVVVVAAAGCDGSDKPFWPAASRWTLSVGGLDTTGRARAPWSNFGRWVDVYVPGEDLVNVYPTGTFVCDEPPARGEKRQFAGLASWSGTSFSCALMCGLLAAEMSATGLPASHAAAALLDRARAQAIRGVGAVLYPA